LTTGQAYDAFKGETQAGLLIELNIYVSVLNFAGWIRANWAVFKKMALFHAWNLHINKEITAYKNYW